MTKTEANARRSDAIPGVAVFDGSLEELRKRLSAEAKRKESESGYTYLTVRIPKDDRNMRVFLSTAMPDLVELSLKPSDALAEKVMALVAGLAFRPKKGASHILAEARMRAEARAEIMSSDDWVTSAEIAELAGFSSINPSAQPNRWKRQRRIFSIRYRNADRFPIYALDCENGYRPVKALADVLKIFGGSMSGWGLALWFSSMNGFLDDARPQDVLPKHPERVIAAARNEMIGVAHG